MLAPRKKHELSVHVVACPDCQGSCVEPPRSDCCGGQGCSSCSRHACSTCDGAGSREGYETCDGEIVSVDETFALHHGREDLACPVEDCCHCAGELAEARRMYGHGGEPGVRDVEEAMAMRRYERTLR